MGSFARLAANALSEFIGGADDVATKGSDDLVATSVKADKKAITKTSSTPSWFKETEVNTNIKAEDSAKTQITTTTATYEKALAMLPKGKTLDYGAGKGVGAKKIKADTYEPFPDTDFKPNFTDTTAIKSESYDNIINLNVLNVVKPEERTKVVKEIGRVLKPQGEAIITTRGIDVFGNPKSPVKGKLGNEPLSVITSKGTYQKGFKGSELLDYIQNTLGDNFVVSPIKLGAAGVKIKKLKSPKITKSSLNEETQYMSSDDSFVSKRIIEKPKGTKPYEEFETGYETKFRVLDPDDPDVLSNIARKNETFPKRVQEALFAWNKREGGISSKELRKILKEEGWDGMLDLRQLAADAKNGATDLLPPKSFDPEQKALRFELNKGGIVKKGLMAR